MSNIMRQKLGRKTFPRCAKIEPREVPDHSKAPWSRETPTVISDGVVLTLSAMRKAMKFAVEC
jgi:hypothetical protein